MGFPGQITDGHVDGMCVFVSPATAMLDMTADQSDPNYGICETAKQTLLSESDANGKQSKIIEFTLALDVAHINFYIANDGVIVPLADDKRQDDTPLSIIRNTFPERKVVSISARTLARGSGGVHCITQQVPKTISIG